MGLRDRDYVQQNFNGKKRKTRRTGGRSAVVVLIAINLCLWLANGLLFPTNDLTDLLRLRVSAIFQESSVHLASGYQLLTYGFAHDPFSVWHIALNMLGLLMFGYGMMLGIGPGGFGFVRSDNVEQQLGRGEFTAFYLLTIVLGGVVFALINLNEPRASVLGASGGVCGVIILFAWMFPRKMLLLWGILPLPMWVIGVLIVVMDAAGAARIVGCCGIAYAVHLAGAACGTLYYFLFLKGEITLTSWLASASSSARHKPDLRIHTPEDTPADLITDDEFNRLLDDVLKRYGEVGEAGLTLEEREFLQRASRRFAEKHRKSGK